MAVKKSVSKMRINIKSFDHRLLEDVVKKLVTVVTDSGAQVV
jgi:ribosomal protein S10